MNRKERKGLTEDENLASRRCKARIVDVVMPLRIVVHRHVLHSRRDSRRRTGGSGVLLGRVKGAILDESVLILRLDFGDRPPELAS